MLNKTLLAAGLLFGSIAANAVVVEEYLVSNTTVNNCQGGFAPHGLWTGLDFGTEASCSNYFSIQEGKFLLLDEVGNDGEIDTGYLSFTATNNSGIEAELEFFLSGFEDDYSPVKDPNVGNGVSGGVYPQWDFFTNIDSNSTITFSNGATYSDFGFVTPDGYNNPLVLQYGPGANDKDSDLGLSSWLTNDDFASHHWDINVTLVPEPSSLGLMTLGLLGLGLARRRQAKAAK